MNPSRRCGPAFRLGDLLVVMLIVVISVGLLMPALQTTRGRSKFAECTNNLKQIGLAVHNFASVYSDTLPALTCDTAVRKYGAFNGGIFFDLLPFLEQEVPFKASLDSLPDCTWYSPIAPNTVLPFSTTPPGIKGWPLCAWSFKVYQCPADASGNNYYHGSSQSAATIGARYDFSWAGCNYAANYQVFGSQNNLGSPASGNACWPKYTISNVPDGTSNTVFFGEQFQSCGGSAGSLWAYPGIGNYSGTQYSSAPGARPPTGIGNSIVNIPGATNSMLWAPVFANSNARYGFVSGGVNGSIFDYNNQQGVQKTLGEPFAIGQYWDAPPQFNPTQNGCDKSRLQGLHANVTLVLLGDASARVVAENISQKTWHSAILPDDGVELGSDW
jgi:type II secretory pathway pseudopilin PulG